MTISDIDDRRGDPTRYGKSPDGRIVHIEGLLISGADLTEGIDTNAPRASIGMLHLDTGTVWVKHHLRSGWNRSSPNFDRRPLGIVGIDIIFYIIDLK